MSKKDMITESRVIHLLTDSNYFTSDILSLSGLCYPNYSLLQQKSLAHYNHLLALRFSIAFLSRSIAELHDSSGVTCHVRRLQNGKLANVLPISSGFRVSTDGGATFADKINLSNSTAANSEDVEISADGSNVVVTWWERNATSDEPVARISSDDGASFGPLLMLSTNGTIASSGG